MCLGFFEFDLELLHLLEVRHFPGSYFFVAPQFLFAELKPTADGHHRDDHHPHSVPAQEIH
jgi:hypothetical protein